MTQQSIIMTLATIKDFVRWCKKTDENLAGFNVRPGRKPNQSFIIGKDNTSLMPKYVLPIDMDWVNPVERPLIANAIHEALYGESMQPEDMEAEMVSKTKDN